MNLSESNNSTPFTIEAHQPQVIFPATPFDGDEETESHIFADLTIKSDISSSNPQSNPQTARLRMHGEENTRGSRFVEIRIKRLVFDQKKGVQFGFILLILSTLILTVAIVLRKPSSTEVTAKSEENNLPRGVAKVLFKVDTSKKPLNVSQLIYSGDVLYSVVQTTLDKPPILMMNTYVNDEVSKNGNSPQHNTLTTSALFASKYFASYDGKSGLYRGQNYRTDQCYFLGYRNYGYGDTYFMDSATPPFPKYTCTRMPSKIDQSLKLACFYRTCTIGIQSASITGNLSDAIEEHNSIGTRYEGHHSVMRTWQSAATEDLVPEARDTSGKMNRETFAATHDPEKPNDYFVFTSNMTLIKLRFEDGSFNVKELHLIDNHMNLNSELFTAITFAGKYLWALVPKAKALAKISIEEKKVLDLISLEPMTKEIDVKLKEMIAEKWDDVKELPTNLFTNFFIMTGLVYVKEHNLFYLSGQFWPYRYAFRLSDGDMK